MKRCPFCAGKIQAEAIVCKHCGKDLPQIALTPPRSKKLSPMLLSCLIVLGLLLVIVIISGRFGGFLGTPTKMISKTTARTARPSGNSMGAIIGSLYVSNPSTDLKTRYRELMAEYIRLTGSETLGGGVRGGILAGLAAMLLSGGTVGWQAILGGGLVGGAVVPKFDNDRFRRAMDPYFKGIEIQNLPVQFAISYQ